MFLTKELSEKSQSEKYCTLYGSSYLILEKRRDYEDRKRSVVASGYGGRRGEQAGRRGVVGQ